MQLSGTREAPCKLGSGNGIAGVHSAFDLLTIENWFHSLHRRRSAFFLFFYFFYSSSFLLSIPHFLLLIFVICIAWKGSRAEKRINIVLFFLFPSPCRKVLFCLLLLLSLFVLCKKADPGSIKTTIQRHPVDLEPNLQPFESFRA